MEEIVTQYTVEEVKQILFENKATPEQAATLLAIGYLESKFTHGIDGATDSNDVYIGDMGVAVHGIVSLSTSGAAAMAPTITLYVG